MAKKQMVVEFDTERKTVKVTDFDGDVFNATGFMMLLGNSPEEGDCFTVCYGDYRSMAEAFAKTAGDEKFTELMTHIRVRMGKRYITAEKALENFEADSCKCDGNCVCKNRSCH